MGGSPDPKGSFEKLFMNPGDEKALRDSLGQMTGATSNAITGANSAAQNYQTNFQQFTPTLNTEFGGPQFSNQLDPFSQSLVSQGQQANQNRLQAQQSQIAQQLGSRNPIMARVLQAQAGVNAQMGQNPLLFQAAAQQRDRQAQEYQLGQQAQASTNAARTQQGQLGADFLGLQNAAWGQKAQLQAAPAQLAQTLTAILAGIANMTGTKTSYPHDEATVNPDSSITPTTASSSGQYFNGGHTTASGQKAP